MRSNRCMASEEKVKLQVQKSITDKLGQMKFAIKNYEIKKPKKIKKKKTRKIELNVSGKTWFD